MALLQVWDGLSNARIEFSAWDVKPEASEGAEMAKFVENINLQKALLTNVKKHDNVEVIDKTKVQEITQGDLKSQGGWPIVKLENGRTIRARLLVSLPLGYLIECTSLTQLVISCRSARMASTRLSRTIPASKQTDGHMMHTVWLVRLSYSQARSIRTQLPGKDSCQSVH